MKVLQINAVYGHGSTGLIVQDIEAICEAEGIECYVASPDKRVKAAQKGYVIGNAVDRKIHAFLCRLSGKQGYFSHVPTWKLCHYISKIEPDVIHLHNLHSNYINLPILLKYLGKHDIATVVTLHDCWFFTGGCTHYTSVGCMKWTERCGHCPRRYDDFPAYLSDTSSKQLTDRKRLFEAIPRLAVVGASEWIAQEASRNVFKGRKCIAIHNGIDTDFFKPTQSVFRKRYHIEKKYVIVSLAAKWYLPVNEETRTEFLKRATDDIVIVLIGRCDNPVKHKNIIHLGFVSDRSLLRDIFSTADLFVNLTREDTLPTINMEVQACGTPIVAYDNTGVKETIAPFADSVVENNNAEALIDKVFSFKRNGKISYSEKCRNYVLEFYQRGKNFVKYIELFKHMEKNKVC